MVLDGHTLNPGDLSWAGLEALGECAVYDRTPAADVEARARDAGILIINKVVFNRGILERLPALRYIGVTATGYNVVDVEAARERGVVVTNVPTYGTDSVAQMVFAHVLNLTQRVVHHAATVKAGRWAECPDFCYWDFPLAELSGLTMGIVGLGRIGRRTAELARAFGMRVVAYDPYAAGETVAGVEVVGTPEEVFRAADVLSLHCPLTPETESIVNAERLALMKPSAYLVNTSRGPLIDEAALADALNGGRLAGAGLDVLAVEPATSACPLLDAANCFVTPHIAWGTAAARGRLMQTVVENVKAFLAGQPRNVV